MKKKQDYKQLVHIFGLARDQFNQRSGRKECIRRRVEVSDCRTQQAGTRKSSRLLFSRQWMSNPPTRLISFCKSQDIQDDKTMKV